MIFDAEADGLLPTVTKIHVLAYTLPDGKIGYTHDYDEMRKLLTEAPLLIGHDIIRYDVPMLEKVLGIKIKARLIDTLSLSWYLNHSRIIHGLDSYGKDYGIPKPKIDNWEDLSPEEYRHRCVEDVKINRSLWKDLKSKLMRLYNNDKDEADRLITYLTFKMDCLAEQQRSQWKLDVDLATTSLSQLKEQEAEKIPQLVAAMPPVIKTRDQSKPAKPFKKDGTLSAHGAKWNALLKKEGLPLDFSGTVPIFVSEEPGNPGSHAQIKDWLFSMGWVPETFDYKKNEDGTDRKIPQVRIDGDEGKELCPSVKKLIPDNPPVAVLEGLTVIQHRISIFEGFLKNSLDGMLTAEAAGFTNTLRLKHRVLVNLPGVDKAWGEEIRGCLVAPEGYVLCGSDMVSLEDTTKRHYMYPYDPEYVEEMSKEGFDPHLDLATHAGAVTAQEVLDYVVGKAGAKNLKPIRKNYKAANYSCIYGVGKAKLALSIGETQTAAGKLIEAYWERNWSVKQLAEDTITKTINGEMWLYNPVSRFWYSLRFKKDIFSTLNQGTGVYCFDRWIQTFRAKRSQLTAQFHDEVVLCIKEGFEDKCRALLKNSIREVNEELKLNIDLDIDVQFGKNYAEIH